MEPKITPSQTAYPGDEAFAKFLVKSKCPEPFHVVRFRFWGQMTSVATRVSPINAISHLWKNELPEFENDDEAQLFFDTMFSLWNALSEMNMAGRKLQLSQRHGLDNAGGLKHMIKLRSEELDDGFFSGFIGEMTTYDKADPKVEKQLNKISDYTEKLTSLLEELEDDEKAFEAVRSRFLALDKSAQRMLDATVKAANAQRLGTKPSATIH